MKKKTKPKLRITQIAIGHWRKKDKQQFSVLGLGSDSKIYRWVKGEGRWRLFYYDYQHHGKGEPFV